MAFDLKEWNRYSNSYHERFCDRFNIGISSAFNAGSATLQDEAQVEALFLLLDKAYSAGLRRTARGLKSGESPVPAIVRRIYGNRTRRAKFLALTAVGEMTFSRSNLTSVVQRVNKFAQLLLEVNGGKRLPLSFSSKFLHFRTGIVPIWDSLARRGLCSVMGRSRFESYEDYAAAILDLLIKAYKKQAFVTSEIKRLDNYLLEQGSA